MSAVNTIAEFLQTLALQAGIRATAGELALTLVSVLGGIVVLLLFAMIFGGKKGRATDKDTDRKDRASALAGKFERFEMEANASQTELFREISFLKDKVSALEAQVRRLHEDAGIELEEILPEEVEEEAEEVEVSADADEEVLEEVSASVEQEPVAEATEEEVEEAEAPVEVEALNKKLKHTRSGIFQKIKAIFVSSQTIDEETLDELEALLVSSDLGVKMTQSLIEDLKVEIAGGAEVTQEILVDSLKSSVREIFSDSSEESCAIAPERREGQPLVVMMVGVNGVGKTTTTAKLASKWKAAGKNVLMVAADTFRAAATDQLKEWGQRIDVPVVSGAENAKPSTVVFEGMERAKKEDSDVIIIDTAGRLHTKSNLMEELEGIRNVVQRHVPGAPHEVVLVVDGSTGQNALSQAKEFHESVQLTGLVVTKLDGTPKGGIVVAIKSELGLPVRYIGVGESSEDLRIFNAPDFVDALFDGEVNAVLDAPSAHGRRRRKRREAAAVA